MSFDFARVVKYPSSVDFLSDPGKARPKRGGGGGGGGAERSLEERGVRRRERERLKKSSSSASSSSSSSSFDRKNSAKDCVQSFGKTMSCVWLVTMTMRPMIDTREHVCVLGMYNRY